MNFLYAIGNEPNVLLAKYGIYGFWIHQAKIAGLAALFIGAAILINKIKASRNYS